MPHSGHELTKEQAQNKYDAILNSFFKENGRLQFVYEITQDFKRGISLKKIKRGTVLFQRHKLQEEIRRFFAFLTKNGHLIQITDKKKENSLKSYDGDGDDDAKEYKLTEAEKTYYMNQINESISFDRGRRFQFAIDRSTKEKPQKWSKE